jgi:hypothetical protein
MSRSYASFSPSDFMAWSGTALALSETMLGSRSDLHVMAERQILSSAGNQTLDVQPIDFTE